MHGQKRWMGLGIAILAASVLFGCGDGRPPKPPPAPRIAFISERDGNREIYTMNPDGTDQCRLTDNLHYDLSPDWSPDRKTLSFISDRTGKFHIYLMNADGTNQRRLTQSGAVEGSPSFSPDGKKIVFVQWDDDADLVIWNLQTGKLELKLTDDSNVLDGGPVWGKDGKIYFVRTPFTPSKALWLLPPDSDPGDPLTWHKAGLLSSFVTRHSSLVTRQDDLFGFWVINPDGTGLRQLTKGLRVLGGPVVSPDAKVLGFLKEVGTEEFGIFLLPMPQTEPLQSVANALPFVKGLVSKFAFSPDGKELAFAMMDEEGDMEIFVARPDGSQPRKLTNNQVLDTDPAW